MLPEHPLITMDFGKHARLLNDLPFSAEARRFYEMMSGALMWEDEKIHFPSDELGWYRAALAYRTSLILGHPRTEFEPIWDAIKQVAPNWIGFLPERCKPSTELAEFIDQQRKDPQK